MGDVWTTPTIGSAMRGGAGLPIGQGEPDGEPGFFESLGLGWQRGRAAPDWGYNQRNYEEQIAFDLYKPLLEKGYVTRPMDDSLVARIGRSVRGQPDPFWAALARARAAGEKLPHEDVADAASMTKRARDLRRGDMAQADARLANGSTAGMLAGELLAGMADPTSYIPVGGAGAKGASLARRILTMGRNEALANAGLATAMEPWVQRDADAMGVPRTAGDAVTDIAVQGGAGFVLGGIGGAVDFALRGRQGDDALADDFEAAVPSDQRTEDEQASLGVLRGLSDTDRASPFEPSPRADDVHQARWQNAGAVARGERSYAPAVKRATPAEVAGGAPLNLRFGGRERYKAMVRSAESGGNDTAKAASSSAYGRYQPIKSTWLGWWRQRYPSSGLTEEQILSKRADGALQELFMDDFSAQNAAALRQAGFDETADNLYLAHFLGVSDAVKILSADANAPVAGLVRGKSIASNRRILEGKTAGELRAWAARKMGGEAGAPVRVASAVEGGEAVAMEPPREALTDIWARMNDDAPDGGWHGEADVPRLRPELFATPEAHARAQIAMEADIDAWEGYDIVDRWSATDEMGTPTPTRSRAAKRGPMDLMQFLATKGGLRDDEGHDLKGMLTGNPYIWGIGNVVKSEGMALDRALEQAVEAGYFGDPRRTDLTTADLLDALDHQHRSGERRFAGADQAEMDARRQRIESDEQYAEFADRLDNAVSERGIEAWSQEDTLRGFELWDGDFDRTIDRVIGEQIDQAQMDDALRADPGLRQDMARMEQSGFGGDARLSEEEMMAYDDPHGPAALAQAASVEHDVRMLADAEPDALFQLAEDGEARSLADILAELDEETASVEAIRACL